MINRRNYPQLVSNYAFDAVKVLEDSLEEDIGKQELFDAFAEELMKKFVSGEPLDLDETLIEKSFEIAIKNSVFNSLIRKGVIDMIENENGEEIYFLTREGKRMRDFLAGETQT